MWCTVYTTEGGRKLRAAHEERKDCEEFAQAYEYLRFGLFFSPLS